MVLINKSIKYRGYNILRTKYGWKMKRNLRRPKAFKNLIDVKNYIDKVKK